MADLLLIKHARPQVLPEVPARDWSLSEAGRQSCAALARRLEPYGPEVFVTSDEPKAVETGRRVAEALGRPCGQAPGLHEHDRSNVPHLPAPEFIASMELFFRRPDELVLGRETARQALRRFSRAMDDVLAAHAGKRVGVVAHGTVIALFVAYHTGESGYRLWRQLQLPSFVVLRPPDFRLVETVARIEA